ncbi:hypothetical protein HY024_01990 [Candidatus Curtissbacteria bacterium]|nr:hypothetical protein [Candidatus Curtissbacteria bacterium]
MKLFEFEGHKLLQKAGIESPFFVVCENLADIKKARLKLKFPVVAKVQVLSGKRGKNGGIVIISREAQLLEFAKEHLGKEFPAEGGEKVKYIVVASKVDLEKEYYVSITYDTISRMPFMLFSEAGGVEIEEMVHKGEEVVRVGIDPTIGPKKADFRKISLPFDFVEKLWLAFSSSDARLVEINPLAKTKDGKLVAIDAKVILDDNGLLRHTDLEVLPKGAASSEPTERELQAHKIDETDYRGSAGSAFIEFPGDIAILASGGGASLLIMDAIAAAGGAPANYTEYSGNPSREKVEKLTKITLSKDGLAGCLVCGAFANFTDIFETLSGFADAILKMKTKVKYPIVIRRGGPKQEQAYEMLRKLAKKEGFDIHLYGPDTPMSVAAHRVVELSEQYKRSMEK